MSRILVVDNDRDIVESLRIVLESAGYSVVSAVSGEEGWTKVRAENPDLVILDVMMETINKGYEICDRIKKDGSTRHIPVILLTAIKELSDLDYDMNGRGAVDMEDAAQDPGKEPAAADVIYEKPVRPEELLRRVRLLLGEDR